MTPNSGTTKTLGQVQADLFKILCDKANNLAKSLGESAVTLSSPPTTDNLKDILIKVSKAYFKKSYHYDYGKGSDCTPSDKKSGTPDLQHTEELCSITSASHIEGHVKTEIVKNVSSAVRETAESDLNTLAKTLYRTVTGNDWSVQPFDKVYDSPDHDENSVKTNAVFIYVNAHITEDCLTASITFLYYLGIYYEITPPKETAKNELFVTLCNDANKLLPEADRLTLSTPPTTDQLTKILGSYGRKKFAADFKYTYNAEKSSVPDGLKTSTALITGTEQHAYIQDKNSSSIGELLKKLIFSSLKLPDWAENDNKCPKDLMANVISIFNGNTSNAWSSSNLDRTYYPSNSQNNAIKASVELIYGHYSKTDSEGDVVTSTFLFCVCVYYEVLSPYKAVYDDLLKELCENANKGLKDDEKITLSSPATTDNLEKVLTLYAKKKFLDTFSYKYDGKSTQPTKKSTKSGVHFCTALSNMASPTEADVKSFVEHQILNEMGSFPNDIYKKVLDDLTGEVKYCFGTTSTDNGWDKLPFDITYSRTDSANDPIKTNAVLIYVNASRNEQSKNDTTVTMGFVFYMGVYFGIDPAAEVDSGF